MKKLLSLVLAFALAFTMLVVPAVAAEVPTATIIASLEGEVPAAGQVFLVTMSIKDASTSSLTSGQINWNWPGEVASLVDIMELDNPYVLSEDDVKAGYHLGNQINPFEGRTGKFSFAPGQAPNLATGYAAAGIYIDNGARDKSPEALEAGTTKLFDVAYVINEGYTYDDFYIELLGTTTFILDPNDDTIASSAAAGDITLDSQIAKKVEVIYYNSKHQPGVNSGDVDGVYELPQALTTGRTYEVSFTLETSGTQGNNTLVALNNAAQMTANNYFGNSTVMMKFDGNTDINVRNGANTVKVGSLSNAATTVDVKYTVDLINNVWGVTVTENGAVTVEQSGLAFRNANLPIDALVLADNDSIENCMWVNADSIKIVDTTPASIGDVVFKYVTADGTVLETATMSGETGATVEVATKTITDANGVKYEAPAASGVVGTDAEVTVTCAKIETVTISYTVAGVEVATATVEGVDGAEVAYDSGRVVTATGVYSKAGTVTVDAENLTAVVELDVVAEGLVSADGQTVDGVYALDKVITNAGTVTFDMAVLGTKDTLVAINNGAVMGSQSNYFQESSAYVQIDANGAVDRNDGAGRVNIGAVEIGKTYSVEYVLDVTNKKFTVTITDAEGTEVVKAEDVSMRNTAIDVIDSIVLIDNGGAGAGAVVVSNLVVVTDDEQPSEDEPTAPSEDEDEPTAPSEDEDEPTAPSEDEDEPTAPSEDEDEPTAPSEDEDEPTAPSEDEDEPTAPSEDEDEPTAPSEDEDEPTAPSEDEDEPTAPSEDEDEPTEDPGDVEELPYEAVDVVVEDTALGVKISGKFVQVEGYEGDEEAVVVVISYFKDGKAYSVQAVEVEIKDGEVKIPASNVTLAEGELTVAGISVLKGVNALEAITSDNLGTPVGVWTPAE